MKYMLLVYLDEQAMTESERERCYVESAQLSQQLNTTGQYLDASPLHPVSTATSVQVRAGKRIVTDVHSQRRGNNSAAITWSMPATWMRRSVSLNEYLQQNTERLKLDR